MASTYSNIKIQLMATGENSTTWGDVTNINLGTAIEEAIVGSADVTFASANVTLTLSNTNASQTARNLRLRCIGTTGGSTRNLVVPSIEKPYIVANDCADSILVKTAAGNGITVPAGKTMWVYSNGTDVVDVTTHLTSLTLATALPILSGGTGSNTTSGARTNLGLGTIATQNANAVAITGGSITGITDLAIADGGTGASTAADARTNLGATTIGGALFTLASPNAIRFLRINADNTVTAQDASSFRTSIDAPSTTGGGASGTWGISVTGNAGTVTNGVYTTGNQTIGGTKTFSSTLLLADGGFMFTSDVSQDTGINWASDGVMNVRCNSVTVGQFNSTGFTGNAATATNGVVTTGSYANPSWITSLAGSKISGNISGNAANVTGTVAIANGGTGATTAGAALSALGAYPSSNPSGFTSNAGTVTSVSGTGTASGLTLSGTVTSSGNLTLSGTVNSLAAGTYAISISGNAATATSATSATSATNATNAANLVAANFSVVQSGTNLLFQYNGTTIAVLDSTGNFTAKNNVTAYGSI